MFTMAKIKNGRRYLDRHLAANDYYSEKETVVGRWVGRGAEKLGLAGAILAGDRAFDRLRRNRLPDGSGKLTPRDGANRVGFFDFQCGARKSVSVMAVTMGDTRLLEAHDRASKLAFGELEKFAARQANTALVRVNVNTGNVIAGSFRHTASRILDPQVHTHFVTVNATWDGATKSWWALTEFEMVSAVRYAGKVYQNELGRACRTLGYDIAAIRDRRGIVTGFELAGVSAEICERFSKRREEVERGIAKFRADRGREPTTGEVHAITVATRNAKLAEITTPAVVAAQRGQLAPAELNALEDLKQQAIARSREPGYSLGLGREHESLQMAISHVYERRSVAAGHEILAEALNQNLGHLELSALQSRAKTADLVGLTGKDWLHDHFATRSGLAFEQWAVDFVNRTRNSLGSLGRNQPQLSDRLSREQRQAATDILASRDQIVCLRGAAGVGKTTVLTDIWREIGCSGSRVYGCAPTSAAADTLRKDGLPATTLAEFLQNAPAREGTRLKNAVFVVDEAGLGSNRQGAELLRLAERYSARIVFLGDSRQHSAVEAGDFLRVLESHSKMHRVELMAIRRQEHRAYREAVGCLASGAAKLGLEKLDSLGWVKEGRGRYIQDAASDFARLAGEGRGQVLAVTPTWAEQEAFTRELRARLNEKGILGPAVQVTVHQPLKWTQTQASDSKNYEPGMVVTFNRASGRFRQGDYAEVSRVEGGRVFVRSAVAEGSLPLKTTAFSVSHPRSLEVAAGDRILIRANDRRAGLLNGEVLTVYRIEGLRLHLTDGRIIDPVRFREFTHGYAVTSHAAQSKTADHVIVAAERLDAKAAYVACSRGRFTCTIHTPDKAALFDRLPAGNRPAALDMIEASRREKLSLTVPRTGVWAQAKEYAQAVRRAAARVWSRGAVSFKEVVQQARRGHARFEVDSRRLERAKQIEIDHN